MNIASREYKLLVNHEPFTDPNQAVKSVWREIEEAVETLPSVRLKGAFDKVEERTILFLDTPDQTLRRHGLVLRQRSGDKAIEFTLKCRSEDRYLAAGTEVAPAKGVESEVKFEEDIAPPFRCRFSHSATICMKGDRDTAGKKMPETLAEAMRWFPVLTTLRVNELVCPPATPLTIVIRIIVDETVWKGGKIAFDIDADDDEKSEKATIALILWTRGKHARPGVAELSFRLKDKKERYSRDVALSAQRVYQVL